MTSQAVDVDWTVLQLRLHVYACRHCTRAAYMRLANEFILWCVRPVCMCVGVMWLLYGYYNSHLTATSHVKFYEKQSENT